MIKRGGVTGIEGKGEKKPIVGNTLPTVGKV